MKRSLLFAQAAFLSLAMRVAAAEVRLSAAERGVEIDAGDSGRFVLEYPSLVAEDGKPEKPAFEPVSETEGIVKYANGVEVRIVVKDGEVSCQFEGMEGAKALIFQILIPEKSTKGASFVFGSGEKKEFPTAPTGQFLETSNGRELFTFSGPLGQGFTVEAAANWQAVQDNRKFGIASFAYQFLLDLKARPGQNSFLVKIAQPPKS